MKQFAIIFLFVVSTLYSEPDKTDVNHMIVMLDGETLTCFVDSITNDKVFFHREESSEIESIRLKKVYYIYNDFDRVFYYSWSFGENIRRMQNRKGWIHMIAGDTIYFTNIEFNDDMVKPEIFATINPTTSRFIPLLEVEKVITDYTILHYSIERGFFYSFYTFLISATVDIRLKWDDSRRLSPQVWDQYNDLLPMASIVGLDKNGVTFESVSFLIPISVLTSMIYDLWKNKHEFYFTPVYEDKKFGRNMYVFSLGHITYGYTKKLIRKMENTKLGGKVIQWVRKKIK